MGFFDRFRSQQEPTWNNEPADLLAGDFFLMVLPVFHVFGEKETYLLKDRYPNVYQNALCRRTDYRYRGFDTARYLDVLKEGGLAAVELTGLGTLLFANYHTSDLFQILQRHYREHTCYVFNATKEYGYFKILENGVIRRKIASDVTIDGVGSYPEVRGKPCQFELERGKIYKLDGKATCLKDMLLDFARPQILELLDYYVGIDNIVLERVADVQLYTLEK